VKETERQSENESTARFSSFLKFHSFLLTGL